MEDDLMYRSNPISDAQLDIKIELLKQELVLMEELKQRRSQDGHRALYSEMINSKIAKVKCSCGEITKYKKPLTTILDFHCPQDRSK